MRVIGLDIHRSFAQVAIIENQYGTIAEQNLGQASRRRQAEVIDVRAAGVEFIDENGGGPGVLLRRNRQQKKG
jgi:hypothetical protein